MSFQQGLSGLAATSSELEVIGNNIANANTYGAKAARAEFGDIYAVALNGAGLNSIGIGVNVMTVAQQFTQGNIFTTDNPMDLAINGEGFFQVNDGSGGVRYTRNGQFKVDRDGYIVNNTFQQLMGYPANSTGVVRTGAPTALQLPTGGVAPAVTSEIRLEFNVDSRGAVTAPGGGAPIDFNDPSTYNNATSMTVYDDKGQEVTLTYYFQKSATDTWNVFITANGIPTQGTAAAPVPETTLTFAPDGSAPTAPTWPLTFNVPATTNAAGAATMPITGIELSMAKATQYGAGYGMTDMTQNGYASGQLTGITIERNGIVMARYSNGQSQPAGQLEIATFRNPQGLQAMGDNGWIRTYLSGDPIVGVPGEGNLGVLQSGALEESNVDLTGELVHMITAQRAYQANAQTIKTQDQVLQTLLNLR
jgi:flagellar hook protein FlgE